MPAGPFVGSHEDDRTSAGASAPIFGKIAGKRNRHSSQESDDDVEREDGRSDKWHRLPDDPISFVGSGYLGSKFAGMYRQWEFDVSELFSQPRTTTHAHEFDLKGGFSIDIECKDELTGRHYDLNKPSDREAARRLRKERKSYVWILTPPCTKFSAMQTLRKTIMRADEWKEAMDHVKLSIEFAYAQLKDGLHFIFEHPLSSRVWKQDCMKKLMARGDVYTFVDATLLALARSRSRRGS